MTRKAWLCSMMFLLVFGPKISGWLDVVSVASVVCVGVHFLTLNTRHIPASTFAKIFAMTGGILLLLTYATGHYLAQPDADPHQVLRFGRVLVNATGVAALVSMYYHWYGDDAKFVIGRHLYHCLVAHAAIMLAMFISTDFRHAIVNHVVQADPNSRTFAAKASGYRIAGLTDSWDALSGLESLGLLMLPILLSRFPDFSVSYATATAPLLLFAVAISGRTGFVTLAALVPLSMYFADLRRIHRTVLMSGVLTALLLLVVAGPLRDTARTAILDSSLARSLAIFGWDSAASTNHSTLGETFEGVKEHYFLPDDPQVFWFGTGGSGRDTWDYVPADNGLILNLHNLGFLSFMLMYGLLGGMLWSGWAVRRIDPGIAGLCILSVSLVLLIDAKVLYVYARNGFTVMLVPVLITWWEQGRVTYGETFRPAEARSPAWPQAAGVYQNGSPETA